MHIPLAQPRIGAGGRNDGTNQGARARIFRGRRLLSPPFSDVGKATKVSGARPSAVSPPISHELPLPSIPTQPSPAAKAFRDVELRYVSDEPGLTRRRRGRGFGYVDTEGRRVTDRATLARIRSLAIPPAWSAVWICADERGHIQATGRDARGRKQYRYHPAWTRMRDETKFERLLEFGEALPRIRRAVKAALTADGVAPLDRDRVIASVVSLLDSTVARVGNREYRRDNGSFGLTTLESRHARKEGGQLRLVFRGSWACATSSTSGYRARRRRGAAMPGRLPGQRLFQYLDESATRAPSNPRTSTSGCARPRRPRSRRKISGRHGSALAFDLLWEDSNARTESVRSRRPNCWRSMKSPGGWPIPAPSAPEALHSSRTCSLPSSAATCTPPRQRFPPADLAAGAPANCASAPGSNRCDPRSTAPPRDAARAV